MSADGAEGGGAVRYLVPVPVETWPVAASGIETTARALAAGRPWRWWLVVNPVLETSQTGVLGYEQAPPWDLVAAAEMSEFTGGFVLVTESKERTGSVGTALAYAGRLVLAGHRDGSGVDASALLKLVTGRVLGSVDPYYAHVSGPARTDGQPDGRPGQPSRLVVRPTGPSLPRWSSTATPRDGRPC